MFCFSFYIFSFEYYIKRKIHAKLDRVWKATLRLFDYSDTFYEVYEL